MKEIYLRGCLLVYTLMMSLVSFAQDDSGEDASGGGIDEMDEFMIPIRQLRFSDIVIVILLLAACYIVSKVWKGCSILLLLAAALIYYLY